MIDIFCKGYEALTNTGVRATDAISDWNDAILDTICVISDEATYGTLEAFAVIPYGDSVIITARAADMNPDLMWTNDLPNRTLRSKTFFYKRDDAYIIEVTLTEDW